MPVAARIEAAAITATLSRNLFLIERLVIGPGLRKNKVVRGKSNPELYLHV
jgi:hypothetical protein